MMALTPSLFLLMVPTLPFLLAVALMVSSKRDKLVFLAPWVILPALLLPIILPVGFELELPWMLLGVHLGYDDTARVFLIFSSILWLVASIYAFGYFDNKAEKTNFFSYFMLAMTGNFGLILAQDVLMFFTFFTLMSLASYGLVVHNRGVEALRAGRIYIILVIVAEVTLFAGFVMATLAAGSTEFVDFRRLIPLSDSKDVIMALVFLGFGIKAGVIGLHVWLPLAHPVAPTPASAVLSGAMIAAGLLGWMRVMPLGEAALPFWGAVMIIAGMVATFYAVFVGVLQRNAKTVLAYSSISSMGIMTMATGLGLIAPNNWPFILTAILVYVMQHGLAKGALFLGVGLCAKPVVSRSLRYLFIVALLIPVLTLAGAPLTSGLIAKHLLNIQLIEAASPWANWVQMLLPWSAIASSALLIRFLFLVWPQANDTSDSKAVLTTPVMLASYIKWGSWLALVAVVALSPWLVSLIIIKDGSTPYYWSIASSISALWSIVLALTVAAGAWFITRHTLFYKKLAIPAGDMVIIVEQWLWPQLVLMVSMVFTVLNKPRLFLLAKINEWLNGDNLTSVMTSLEVRCKHWTVATTLLLVLVAVFVFTLSVYG